MEKVSAATAVSSFWLVCGLTVFVCYALCSLSALPASVTLWSRVHSGCSPRADIHKGPVWQPEVDSGYGTGPIGINEDTCLTSPYRYYNMGFYAASKQMAARLSRRQTQKSVALTGNSARGALFFLAQSQARYAIRFDNAPGAFIVARMFYAFEGANSKLDLCVGKGLSSADLKVEFSNAVAKSGWFPQTGATSHPFTYDSSTGYVSVDYTQTAPNDPACYPAGSCSLKNGKCVFNEATASPSCGTVAQCNAMCEQFANVYPEYPATGSYGIKVSMSSGGDLPAGTSPCDAPETLPIDCYDPSFCGVNMDGPTCPFGSAGITGPCTFADVSPAPNMCSPCA